MLGGNPADINETAIFKLLTQIASRYTRAKKRLNDNIRDIDKQVEETAE